MKHYFVTGECLCLNHFQKEDHDHDLYKHSHDLFSVVSSRLLNISGVSATEKQIH